MQYVQRHASILQYLIMKRGNVELSAKLRLIMLTLSAYRHLPYFIGQCLSGNRHIAFNFGSSISFCYQLMRHHILNRFFARHALVVQTNIHNEPDSPENTITQMPEILVWVVINAEV